MAVQKKVGRMATELIINASLPETRIAMMEDGEIQEVLIERAQSKGITGNIYKGRVTRVLPGMQAAFVDIGLEKAAFLYVDDIYTHSEIWEDEEGSREEPNPLAEAGLTENRAEAVPANGDESASAVGGTTESATAPSESLEAAYGLDTDPSGAGDDLGSELAESNEGDDEDLDSEEDENGDSDEDPVAMGSDPNDPGDRDEGRGNRAPEGTIAPERSGQGDGDAENRGNDRSSEGSSNEGGGAEFSGDVGGESSGDSSGEGGASASAGGNQEGGGRFGRSRRGRRGGRFRKGRDRERGDRQERGDREGSGNQQSAQGSAEGHRDDLRNEALPERYQSQVFETGETASDRTALQSEENSVVPSADKQIQARNARSGFQQNRSRSRRIPTRGSMRQPRPQVNIQDLLQEGQEVIVQIAKDPIATKGARLTCHISLPGRHLVCMPTIDHVGVSRRIESDGERRRLRDFVERNRPKNLGFIVRTASGRQQSAEKQIKQDIDYLAKLWEEIREKAQSVQAPALVYEDLNSVLRAIRDWVTEDIDKVIVDSRYHYNEILRFVSNFMPSLRQKVELYHGDIPIFDAYAISTELSRSLERKVWLKSGGYIVIDQAEAVVAIDVNTGRFVGKKNLEDTILKTNVEAAVEIAYQLRLRNCGGIIILDFIDMEREESRQRVYRTLEEALKKDRARPTIMKISELGLVEMTRKRTRDTIIRTLCEPCLHCEGKGFIKSKQTVAFEALRQIERHGITRETSKILVQAHPDVIDILSLDEREVLDNLERKYRKQIYLQAIGDYHPEQFEVTPDKEPSAERVLGYDRSPRDRQSYRSDRGSERGDRNGNDRHRRNRGDRDRGRDRDRDRDHRRHQNNQAGGQGADRQDRGEQQNYQPVSFTNNGPAEIREGDAPASVTEGMDSQANINSDTNFNTSAGSEAQTSSGESQGDSAQGNYNQGQGQGQGQGQNRYGRGRYGNQRGGRDRDRNRDRGQYRRDYRDNQRPQQNQYPVEPGNAAPVNTGNAQMMDDSYGNSANYQPQSRDAGNVGMAPSASSGEDFSEEDRLAFLRAQAAQDAAIAKLGAAGQGNSMSSGGGHSRGGGRNDRNQRGGGRRGFQQRGGGRNDRFGGGGGGGGKFSRGQRDQRRGGWGRGAGQGGVAEPGNMAVSGPASGGNDGGGSGGGNGGSSSGGSSGGGESGSAE